MIGMVFRLWAMGIRAGLLIGIVLAVRACLKKYPRIYSYCLWIPVGLRLLCPIWIESPFGLLPDLSVIGYQKEVISEQDKANERIRTGQIPEDAVGTTESSVEGPAQKQYQDEPVNAQAQEQTGRNIGTARKQGLWTLFTELVKGEERFVNADFYKPAAVFYLIVSMGFMAYYLARYVRIGYKLRAAVWKQDNIWLNGEMRSPFVMGVIAPKIYLPYGYFNDNGSGAASDGIRRYERNYILEHEQTHIRHHDPLICMVGMLCICLHWWNPLVWLAVSKMQEDMEMFCDETVLASASLWERKDYANALLSYAVKENGLGIGPAFGESHTEKRIKNLMFGRKKHGKLSYVAVFVVVLCAATLFMIPQNTGTGQAKHRSDSKPVQTTPFAYVEYTGYLDACTQWTGHTAFVGQDYDGDGRTDRVFRTYEKDSQYCRYRILFGNNTVLEFEKDVYMDGMPTIKAADLNGDGVNEIILLLQYAASTDMRTVGDFAVFEKTKGDVYVQAKLPFLESEQGYSMVMPLRYEKKREQLLAVSPDGMDDDTKVPKGVPINVPISDWLWVDARYQELFSDVSASSVIWDIFLIEDAQEVMLACKVHLFDKWSDYGLILVLGYEEGRYVVEEVMAAQDEFSNTLPDTRQTWNLSEY